MAQLNDLLVLGYTNLLGTVNAFGEIIAESLSGDGSKIKNISAGNISGTLGVSHGGTGIASVTANAVLTGNGTSGFKAVATANGALYATAANGAPQFGTLPIGQGGTARTTLTANSVIVGNGTSAVKMITSANGALYATAANGEPKFGTLPVGQGGTGKTSWTAYGLVYASAAATLSQITTGTSGYVLQSGGSGAAPSWINATNSNTGSTIVKRDASGNFSAGTISGMITRIALNGIADSTTYGSYGGIIQDSTTGPNAGVWHNSIKILHNNSEGYYTQLAQQFTGGHGLWHRSMRSGTLSSWYKVMDIVVNGNAGSATAPLYIKNGAWATASTYAGGSKVTLNGTGYGSATVSFYAPTSAGTVGQVLVSSGGAPAWSSIAYIKKTASAITDNRTVSGDINALYLYGQTYGNTATNLENDGRMSYGDPGPQIIFNTSASGSQAAALIFTDHDTIASGTSLSLVSNQANVSFIAPTIKALTGFYGNGANITALNMNNATTGTLAVARGGTGHTTRTDATNAFLNSLTTGSSTPTDNDYYISQYVGGGTTTTTYHRRPHSALAAYIKTKIGSAGGATTPVYFTEGNPIACTMSAPTKRWGVLTNIGADGVMEVGKYIDFHIQSNNTNSDGTQIDYNYRLTAASGTLTGSGAFITGTYVKAGTYLQASSYLQTGSYASIATYLTVGTALTVNTTSLLKGVVTLGAYTNQSTKVSGGIAVHDLRNVTTTPGMFGEKRVNFYFDQADNSRWSTIMHMHGWTASDYASGEIAVNAHTDTLAVGTLKYRAGKGSAWSNWHSVLLVDDGTGRLAQKLKFNSTSMAESSASNGLDYVCGITAFDSGGELQWKAIGSLKVGYATSAGTASKLGSSTIGAADRPIYLNAGTATQTTYRMAGTNATATSALAIANDLPTGIWYVSGTSDILGQSDGVCIANQYNSSWITEIYQDYRTGQLAVRGKNNGTWQAWRKVLDSSNWTSVVDGRYLKLSGGTMTGNIIFSDNSEGVQLNNGTYSMSFMIGSGGVNRGIYDHTAGRWMIYADGNNYINLNTVSYVQSMYPNGTGHYSGNYSHVWRQVAAKNYYVYDETNSTAYARLYCSTVGTTSATGVTTLTLGNNLNDTTGGAGNAYGRILLYSTSTGYAYLRATSNTTTGTTHYLPTTGGTLINTGTIASYAIMKVGGGMARHTSGGEVDIGVQYGSSTSATTYLYMYGNNSSGGRGIYDTNAGTVLSFTSNVPYFYGVQIAKSGYSYGSLPSSGTTVGQIFFAT